MFKRCENCRKLVNKGTNFVFDGTSFICTLCGVVQRNNGFEYSIEKNTTYNEQPQSIAFDKQSERMYHMTNLTCQQELKENRIKRALYEMSDQLDTNERTRNRAWLLFLRNKSFFTIRPMKNTIASTIIVACYSLKIPLSINKVSTLFGLKNLSATVKIVCKKLKINMRVDAKILIPSWVSRVGGKYSDNKLVNRVYRALCKKHPSVGTETVLAAAIYKFYKGEKEIEEICKSTGVSLTSLKSII